MPSLFVFTSLFSEENNLLWDYKYSCRQNRSIPTVLVCWKILPKPSTIWKHNLSHYWFLLIPKWNRTDSNSMECITLVSPKVSHLISYVYLIVYWHISLWVFFMFFQFYLLTMMISTLVLMFSPASRADTFHFSVESQLSSSHWCVTLLNDLMNISRCQQVLYFLRTLSYKCVQNTILQPRTHAHTGMAFKRTLTDTHAGMHARTNYLCRHAC